MRLDLSDDSSVPFTVSVNDQLGLVSSAVTPISVLVMMMMMMMMMQSFLPVDILGTNCDQCPSTGQCCFTSSETVRLIRDGSPGRPPRLSHSSRTLIYVHRNRRLIRDGKPRTATSTFTQLLNSDLRPQKP